MGVSAGRHKKMRRDGLRPSRRAGFRVESDQFFGSGPGSSVAPSPNKPCWSPASGGGGPGGGAAGSRDGGVTGGAAGSRDGGVTGGAAAAGGPEIASSADVVIGCVLTSMTAPQPCAASAGWITTAAA
jgi:hypothetical protein